MKIKIAIYRGDSGIHHISSLVEEKDAWLHKHDVRLTEPIEVDLPDRPAEQVRAELLAQRLERINKLREEAEKLAGATA